MKTSTLIFVFLFFFCFPILVVGQLKVFDDGSVIIGDIQKPLTEMQIVGSSFFTENFEPFSVDLSGPMIHGNNRYSTALRPDFTWYNNDQTGIFHPDWNMIGFSLGGQLKVLMTQPATYFFNIVIGSDLKMKENVSKIKNPLAVLKGIHGSSYNYKPELLGGKRDSVKIHYGFIAQYLEQTNPELVETIDEADVKAVDYNGVVAILVESVKSQQEEIEKQREEIQELKIKLQEIEKRLPPAKRKRQ